MPRVPVGRLCIFREGDDVVDETNWCGRAGGIRVEVPLDANLYRVVGDTYCVLHSGAVSWWNSSPGR